MYIYVSVCENEFSKYKALSIRSLPRIRCSDVAMIRGSVIALMMDDAYCDSYLRVFNSLYIIA